MEQQSSLADLQTSVIQHLQSLPKDTKDIDLHSIGLTSLDFAIETLLTFPNLQNLDLHDNSIKKFPDLHELEQLHFIDISENPIVNDPNILKIINNQVLPPLTKVHISDRGLHISFYKYKC